MNEIWDLYVNETETENIKKYLIDEFDIYNELIKYNTVTPILNNEILKKLNFINIQYDENGNVKEAVYNESETGNKYILTDVKIVIRPLKSDDEYNNYSIKIYNEKQFDIIIEIHNSSCLMCDKCSYPTIKQITGFGGDYKPVIPKINIESLTEHINENNHKNIIKSLCDKK